MSSHTINIIGETERNEKGSAYLFYAMNKTEMAQQRKIAKEKGTPIKYWYAQTKAGQNAIGADYQEQIIEDKDIKHINLVTCPICKGIGEKQDNETYGIPVVNRCVVCNGSGICRKGNEKKWQEWQLEEMKKEYEQIL